MTIGHCYCSAWFLSHRQNVYALFWENHEKVVSMHKASYRGFPELVTLVPVLAEIFLDVKYHDIVGVDTNTFKTQNCEWILLLFAIFVFLVEHVNIAVSAIKFVRPFYKVFDILGWVINSDSQEVVTQPLILLVRENIKVIFVTLTVFYTCYAFLFVHIDLLFSF